MVSLAFSVEYSKGESISDVSRFTTQPDIGTEEEPTIKDETEEEETTEDDETEPGPTDEEDNDTVTTVPFKRPTGTDLGLDNLTTAPLEEPGKLIFASCQKDLPIYPNILQTISCNVPGASPGDNVVVSSTTPDRYGAQCHLIHSSKVSGHNVVSIRFVEGPELCFAPLSKSVIFSIIVFRPVVPDIIGTLEELRDKDDK